MPPEVRFPLTDQPIDMPALAAALHDPAADAEVTFDGLVRNHHDGRVVSQLESQAYPALALATGRQILEDEAVAPGAEAVLTTRFRGGLRARILSNGTLRAG